MHLSCSTLVCALKDYPRIGDALAEIAELGFKAVDVAAFEGWQNVDPSRLAAGDEAWAAELTDALARTGLKVSSFNCGLSKPLTDPDPDAFAQVEKELLALAHLAEHVGCPNLTVQPGRASDPHHFAEAFEIAAGHLERLAWRLEGQEVTLSVEGHQGSLLESPEAGVVMMKRLWPAVGFTYDPSHFAMQGIPLPDTEPLLDYVRHVHVRNASPGQMQATMADGVVDFAWLVAALDRRGYGGAVAIEYFSGFDEGFRNTLALRDLLRTLGIEG